MTFAVAIVGLGPKGLYALDSLVHAVARTGAGPVVVDAFEPHQVPGAGPVYDPAQPAYLRMNYSSDQVDIWSSGDRDPGRLPFVAWWTARNGGMPSTFPPRADVGRYLSDGFDRVRDELPSGMQLRVVEGRGVAARPQEGMWELEFSHGADRATRRHRYDEVLIATGHDRFWEGSLAAAWPHPVPLVDAVFPTTSRLAESTVRPGSTVAVRGFGLTFLDAALALTEGRGGRFEPTRRLDRLRYVRAGREPLSILPFSRSGRTMRAKPEPGRFVNIASMVGPYEGRLRTLTRRPDLKTDVLPAVVGLAADLVAADSEPASADASSLRDEIHAHLNAFISGSTPVVLSVEDDLRHSIAAGIGLSRIDAAAALGQSWRSLHPAIVATLSHGGLAERDRPRFLRVAAEMERLSFGPPCENAMKLLALIEAGVVDLSRLAGARVESDDHGTRLVSPGGSTTVDVAVDAVLPPPGLPAGGVGIAHQIVRDGYARVVAGGRGIEVCTDATCVGADGRPTPGLSALGRPTEDSVIGNDSLSRRLHDHPQLWAERVAARAQGISWSPLATRMS